MTKSIAVSFFFLCAACGDHNSHFLQPAEDNSVVIGHGLKTASTVVLGGPQGGGEQGDLAWDGATPHVAYVDQASNVVRHAYRDAQGWHTELVDPDFHIRSTPNYPGHKDDAIVATGPQMIVGPQGQLGIVYARELAVPNAQGVLRELRYAGKSQGQWLVTTIVQETDVLERHRLGDALIDAQGTPYVGVIAGVSTATRLVKLWSLTQGSWSSDALASIPSEGLNNLLLRLDPAGQIYVITNHSKLQSSWTQVARKVNHVWSHTEAPFIGVIDASVEANGEVKLLGRDPNTKRWARMTGTALFWSTDLLPDLEFNQKFRAAYELSTGVPRARVFRYSEGSLGFHHLAVGVSTLSGPAGNWVWAHAFVRYSITQGNPIDAVWDTSWTPPIPEIDPEGHPVFINAPPAGTAGLAWVSYPAFPNEGQNIETIDLRVRTSDPLTFYRDEQGDAHTAFLYGPDTEGHQKVVVTDEYNGVWTHEALPFVVERPGIGVAQTFVGAARGPDGTTWVLYRVNYDELSVWTRTNGVWSERTLNAPGLFGLESVRDCAVDSQGNPHLLMSRPNSLHHVIWTQGAALQTLVQAWTQPSSSWVDPKAHLLIDAADVVHVAWWRHDERIRYGRLNASSWQIAELSSGAASSSIAFELDSTQRPCVFLSDSHQLKIQCIGSQSIDVTMLGSEPDAAPFGLGLDANGNYRAVYAKTLPQSNLQRDVEYFEVSGVLGQNASQTIKDSVQGFGRRDQIFTPPLFALGPNGSSSYVWRNAATQVISVGTTP
jgi:hypothetical protein